MFSHRAAVAVAERLSGAAAAKAGAHAVIAAAADRSEVSSHRESLAHPPAATSADERARTLRKTLRSLMWEHVGIVRSDAMLEEAEHEVRSLRGAWQPVWRSTPPTPEGVELRNLLDTSELIVRCARLRRESRGLHYNVDHPWRNSERYLNDTIVEP